MTAIAFETTKVSVLQSAAEIESLLAWHGATSSAKEYDGNGRPCSLGFQMKTPSGLLAFKLPINVEPVYQILLSKRPPMKRSDHNIQQIVHEQAERTAWRIIREWIHGQVTLIQTEMVTVTEVFMPYMLLDGHQTAYERLLEGGMPALMSPAGDRA